MSARDVAAGKRAADALAVLADDMLEAIEDYAATGLARHRLRAARIAARARDLAADVERWAIDSGASVPS